MTVTLTNGTQTITVAEILGWSSSRSSGNIVHQIIGRRDRDVTLGELGLREGTLTVLCTSLGDATAIETYFATKAVHTLTDTETLQVGMRFVIQGAVTVDLDPETAVAATVGFGFQEVIL